MMFSQVSAPPKARPAGNPHRYPHVAHRSAAPLHKSSTGLRTGEPGLPVPAGRLPGPDSGPQRTGARARAEGPAAFRVQAPSRPAGDMASSPPYGADGEISRSAVTSQPAFTGTSRLPSGRCERYAISIRLKLKDT